MLDPKAKALIFDIDGTLVDTMPLHFIAWMNTAKKHEFPFDEKVFYSLAGVPARQIIELLSRRHGLSLNAEAIVSDRDTHFLELISRARPIPEVVEVVRRAHGRIPMALGTGGTRAIAVRTLDAAGLTSYFRILVCAEDVRRHKPEPDTFLECARQMGVKPEDCQVFEDADKGMEAARRAGMIACDVREHLGIKGPPGIRAG